MCSGQFSDGRAIRTASPVQCQSPAGLTSTGTHPQMGGTWRSSASSSQRNLVNILLDIDVFSLASAVGDSQLCRKLDAVGDVAGSRIVLRAMRSSLTSSSISRRTWQSLSSRCGYLGVSGLERAHASKLTELSNTLSTDRGYLCSLLSDPTTGLAVVRDS